jgi:hypothetical protein
MSGKHGRQGTLAASVNGMRGRRSSLEPLSVAAAVGRSAVSAYGLLFTDQVEVLDP